MTNTIERPPTKILGISTLPVHVTKLDSGLYGPYAMHWDELAGTQYLCMGQGGDKDGCIGCSSDNEDESRIVQRYVFRGLDESGREHLYVVGRIYREQDLIPKTGRYTLLINVRTTPYVVQHEEAPWVQPMIPVEQTLLDTYAFVEGIHDAQIKVGDRFEDNDPRVVRDGGKRRTFTVQSIYDSIGGTKRVQVLDDLGRFTVIRYDRLASDRGKTGYTPIPKEN